MAPLPRGHSLVFVGIFTQSFMKRQRLLAIAKNKKIRPQKEETIDQVIEVATCDVFTLSKRQKGHGLKHLGSRLQICPLYIFGKRSATDSTKPDLNIGESRVWWLEAKAKSTTLKIQAQGFFANHLQPRDVPKEAWPRHPGEFRGPRCLIKHSMFPHSRVSQFLGEFSGHTIFFSIPLCFCLFFFGGFFTFYHGKGKSPWNHHLRNIFHFSNNLKSLEIQI